MLFSRKTITIIISIICIALFSACSKKEIPTIKIGAILPLTGNLAWVGVPERNALLLALEDIKSKNGKYNTELIIEDSQGNVKTAVTAANKLITVDRVYALIVSLSKINKAVAPISKQNNIIHIATTASDPSINDIGENVFRIYENFATEQELLAKWAKKKGYKKISLLRTNDYTINQAATIFIKNAKQQNLEIINDVIFEPDTLDFKNQTQILKSKKEDAVLLMGYGPEYLPILKTFKEQDYVPQKILGMYTFLTLANKQEVSDLTNGIEFVSFTKTTSSNDLKPFMEQYYKKFGQFPGNFINYLFTYDAFKILHASIIKVEGNLTADNIINELIQVKQYKGLSGTISILPSRDTMVDMSIVTFKDGQIEVLENGL